MEEGRICLSSTTYSNHLVDTFKKLFSRQSYADVTLVSDDNQQVQAHKFILSACSPVLDTMLAANPHTNTLLYMRGIKLQELQAIVEFMYLGMTYVDNNKIVEFMTLAKELGIKELTSSDNVEDTTNEEQSGKDSKTGLCPIKKEIIQKVDAFEEKCYNNKLINDGTQFYCENCVFGPVTLKKLKKHQADQHGEISDEHEEILHPCHQCDHKAKSAASLRSHKQNKHDGVRYACDKCEYQATQPSSLKQHISSRHSGIQHVCGKCDFKTSWPKALKDHQRRKRSSLMETL